MSSYNKVVLMGNVVADVDLRETKSGTAVTDLRLAVDDKRGKNDETVFVDVTLWGRTAEIANEYLSKGSPVLIDGRLQMDRWESEEGVKRSKLKIVCDRLKLVGGRRDNNDDGGPPPQHNNVDANHNGENEKDDDIPF